jgi:hypothetical protein
MKYFVLTFTLFSLSHSLGAQTCQTAKGINLSESGGPYSSLWPRDQGSVGTCYVHSASDLLSSYIGGGNRFNVFEAAVANDSSADGGQPKEIMKTLVDRGWACRDTGSFSNLFPSQEKNIISDLMEAVAMSGMPVFYTNDPYSKAGEARQKNIASLAGKLASGEIKPCGAYLDADVGVEEFKKLSIQVSNIEDKIVKLRDEKDPLDGWFGTRETTVINKEIATLVSKKTKLEIQSNKAHERYTNGTDLLTNGRNNLDKYSEQQAAEIIFYWAEKTYPKVEEVFKAYGISSWAPSMKQYIIEKVQRDPVTHYQYAGGMYPYRLMKRVMKNACSGTNRIEIPKTLKTKSMSFKTEGAAKMSAKVESLLEKNPGQGIGISFNVTAISPQSGYHAVNIIGCRTVNGVQEVLLHNSWGSNCKNYHFRYQGPDKCQSGRAWIPTSTIMSYSQEIQWIEK